MIVIIEGPDCSGKSYAIERIAKHFNNGFIVKNTYKPRIPNDDKIYQQYWKITDMISDFHNNSLIILDRFYPSQAVYSIKRGVDEMNHRDLNILDWYFSKVLKAKFILLDTDVSEMEKRYDKRGDEYIQKQELTMLRDRYNYFYQNTDMDKIKINTMQPDWLEQIEVFLR